MFTPLKKFIFGTEYNDHVVMLFREGVMAEKAEEESNRAQWPNSVRGEVARIGFVCKADGDLDTLIKATLRSVFPYFLLNSFGPLFLPSF